MVVGYCRQDFEPAPYPTAAVGVTAKMVARVIERGATDAGGYVDQQNAGPFGVRYSSASSVGDVWLTQADKMALRSLRVGGGLTSVKMVGERYDITETP